MNMTRNPWYAPVLALLLLAGACAKEKDPGTQNYEGLWTGAGTFVDTCVPTQCQYRGSFGLDLKDDGVIVTGQMDFSLVVDQIETEGSICESRLVAADSIITDFAVLGNVLTFTDPEGNFWTLQYAADIVQGTVASSRKECGGYVSSNLAGFKTSKGGDTGVDTTMTWRIVDQCDDGVAVNYRFYDVDNNLEWPDRPAYYTAAEANKTYLTSFTCPKDGKVCLGATDADRKWSWGVGLEGTHDCIDCCFFCDSTDIAYYPLGCDGIPETAGVRSDMTAR
ncbi:MAG: hypothetical protein HQK87_10735 [Nitrospinae bacterium]|nr:hypothetical protein [Nitrospinota bacterium]